jgi:hypothetical protein
MNAPTGSASHPGAGRLSSLNPLSGSFVDGFPGVVHWLTTCDVWCTRREFVAIDINLRMIKLHDNGLVTVLPDGSGSTAWFGDVLRGGWGADQVEGDR